MPAQAGKTPLSVHCIPVSGKICWRTAFRMAVEEGRLTCGLAPLLQRRGLNGHSLKAAQGVGRIHPRVGGPAAARLARTTLVHNRRATRHAAQGQEPLHDAVVLAVPAAAWRKAGFGIGAEDRRN